MSEIKWGMGAAVVNGKAYLIGGNTKSPGNKTGLTDKVEEYDLNYNK